MLVAPQKILLSTGVSQGEQNAALKAGEDAVLECVVEQVRPAAKLTWQGFQQEEILNEQIQVTNSWSCIQYKYISYCVKIQLKFQEEETDRLLTIKNQIKIKTDKSMNGREIRFNINLSKSFQNT